MVDWRTGSAGPVVLGIVNASPESFSGHAGTGAQAVLASLRQLVADGADMLDVGGQSLRTDMAEIPVEDEVARLRPVLELLASGAAGPVPFSVDTYRAEAAAAAADAGASMVNDASMGVDPALYDVCVERGLDVVMTYNIVPPKVRLQPGSYAEDPVGGCLRTMSERLDRFEAAGGDRRRVVVDPGIDLGKSPAQSVQVLRAAHRIRDELGSPRMFWALSRKDFVGSVTGRLPRDRDPGTLGALAAVPLRDGDVVRVHNVRAVVDFLRVRDAVLTGRTEVGELDPALRHHEPVAPA